MKRSVIFATLLVLSLIGCANTPETNVVANANAAVVAVEPGRISLADAKAAFDAGEATFVDTRAEVEYKQQRIKGAINIPAEAMATRWKEIPTDKKIIAYCS